MRCEQFQAERRQAQAEQGDVDAADDSFEAFARRQALKQCPKCKVRSRRGCPFALAGALHLSARLSLPLGVSSAEQRVLGRAVLGREDRRLRRDALPLQPRFLLQVRRRT